MIALAAAASLSAAAAPAFAARYDRYDEQQRQEQTYQYSGLSEHCQQVMSRPDLWGDKEVTFCRDSI
jgi:hypothetical protein